MKILTALCTPYLSQIDVWALSVGSAIGCGSFVMPGTTFLPVTGPLGTALGIGLGMFVMLIIAINYNYLINLYPDYIHCICTHYSQQFQNYEMREEEHSQQLNMAEERAATDQLTGVKNRHAYYLKEIEINEKIDNNEIDSFAIVVCDINDFKLVNDIKGHNSGDQCICRSCKLICDIFKRSPVFRIGGDEFAVILEMEDYENRHELIEKINRQTKECEEATGSTIAVGIADFIKGKDKSVLEVFGRADNMMYEKKNEMKSK